MRVISTIVALLVCFCASAQKQNNNWCFGANAGLDFNTVPPTSFNISITAIEGVATLSNKLTGDLKYYFTTAGSFSPPGVGNYSIGTDVTNTCAQGVAVIVAEEDTGKNMVFALSDYTQKGILYFTEWYDNPGSHSTALRERIDSGFAEAVVIMEACGAHWVVLQKITSGDFYAYKVENGQLNRTPVISKAPYNIRALGVQTMKFSPNKKKLAVTVIADASSSNSYVALLDFDKLHGKVIGGDVLSLENFGEYYGCEFSPNSKRLYVSGFGSKNVFQFDLSLGSLAAINGSRRALAKATNTVGALQMGPDSNIYVALEQSSVLDVITSSDKVFPDCVYNKAGVVLPSGSKSRLGLPQAIVLLSEQKDSVKAVHTDSTLCIDKPMVLHARALGDEYSWQDGSKADSFVLNTPGTYWVRMRAECRDVTDTFIYRPKVDTFKHTKDISICPKTSVTLMPTVQPNGADYTWSDQSKANTLKVSQEGMYWSEVLEKCRLTIDTYTVDVTKLSVSLREDTTLCVGDAITLTNYGVDNGASFVWNTGSNDAQLTVKEAGSYTLVATYKGCSDSDNVLISYYPELKVSISGKDELCKGDELTLSATVTDGIADSLVWFDNTLGDRVTITQAGHYSVSAINQCQTVTDSINVRGRNCNFFFPTAFSPNNDGRNDVARLVGDIAVIQQFSLRIVNRWGQVMYQTDDPTKGWDGTYKGKTADVGSYYFLVKFTYEGDEELLKGDILLMR